MDDDQRRQRLRTLTLEQRAIFTLLCQRKSRRTIAELRAMTEAGVDYHCTQLARKLGLQEGARRRNALEFRLALLEFLPVLLELEAEQIPPTPQAEAEEESAAGATPDADPAVLALVEQMTAPASRRPGEPAPWPPPVAGFGPGAPGTEARRALVRWWRPLALLLVLALAAGIAGGVAAAHLTGARSAAVASSDSTSTAASEGNAVVAASSSSTTPSMPAATPASSTPVARAGSSGAGNTSTPAVLTSPTPLPTATAIPATAAAPRDLAGKVASDLPGTRLTPGDAVSSVLDRATKPRDVYALPLQPGQRLRVTVTATSPDYAAALGDPGAVPGAISDADGRRLCVVGPTCAATVPIATAGTYLLVLDAQGPGVRYTLHTAALPLEVGAGVKNLTATVASDLPGTALTPGDAVTSVIDQGTKRRDVYALTLRAGQTLDVDSTAESADYDVLLLPPGAASVVREVGRFQGTQLCAVGPACHATAPIAAAGTYTLVVEASGPGLQYTLRTAAH